MPTIRQSEPSIINERTIADFTRVVEQTGVLRLAEYRAYAVGHDGQFVSVAAMNCANEGEAIERASRLVDQFPIELWSGERFIIRLGSKNPLT